jgi:hypothetical protein
MPERHEERREQYQQPYYNPPYYGNGGHEGGNFGSNSRHYSRGLGYYGSFYNSPYIYLPPYLNLKPIIGTIAKTRRATIPTLMSVQMAGSRWHLNRMTIN